VNEPLTLQRFVDARDAIAMQTSWQRMHEGGATFQTTKVIKVHKDKYKVMMSIKAFLFYLVILIAGLAILASAFKGTVEIPVSIIIPFLLGLFFIWASLYMFYHSNESMTFERLSEFLNIPLWDGTE